MKRKQILIITLIITLLIITIGFTYAAFVYKETTTNQQLVLGDIYMYYNETNELSVDNMMPMDGNWYIVNPIMKEQTILEENELARCVVVFTEFGYEFDEESDAESYCKGTGTAYGYTIQEELDMIQQNVKEEGYDFLESGGQELLDNGIIISKVENLPYFEFTVSGKNGYSEKDIYYEVLLSHGDVPEGKEEINRIKDSSLRFRLAKVNEDNTETQIFINQKYNNINNQAIWVETIKANTDDEISNKYRLYMWIDEDVTICGGEIKDGCDYYTSGDINNWNNVFASVKVSVHGDFEEKSIYPVMVDLIKSKVGTGGLVAINQEGTLYEEGSLNQTSNVYQTNTKLINNQEIREYRYTGKNVNNYVSFNNEIWRIIGIFKDTVKDQDGNIILDDDRNPLYEEKIKLIRNQKLDSIPTTYFINGVTYNPNYWNKSDLATNTNDWTTAGLMYYLNTEFDQTENNPNAGYLSTFRESAKKLISLSTYYLGNFKHDTDTPISAYESERDENNIHDENQATWNGLIALAYPSDVGYMTSTLLWNTRLSYFMLDTNNDGTEDVYAHPLSWMLMGHYGTAILSPSDENNTKISWVSTFGYGSVISSSIDSSNFFPVLYLKANTKVIDALGTENKPYIVVEN